MKKLTSILLLITLTAVGFAQEPCWSIIEFANGPTPLITYGQPGNETPLPANDVGGFYFGLLVSTNSTGPLTFSGTYATNRAIAGRLFGGPEQIVTNWPQYELVFYEVAGWSSNLGAIWNPGWLVNNAPAPISNPIWSGVPTNSYFGVSAIGSAVSVVGTCGQSVDPPLQLFGGTGLTGFNLAPVGPVQLSASFLSGNMVMSWTPLGGTLQSSPVLGPDANWSAVGTQNPTNAPVTSGARFFRVAP